MLALPGIVLLLAFVYVRPQEFEASLRALPLLYAALGLALLGLLLDVQRRRSRLWVTPLLGWALLLWGWCLVGLAIRDHTSLATCALNLGVDVALYFICAHGVQSFGGLRVVAATLLGLVLFIAIAGIVQGESPLGCHRLDEQREELTLTYDGRSCQSARDCRDDDAAEPGADYLCEHVGPFATSSIGGRVRYRGKLNDPNDLSLAIGVALPFAFALYQRKRTLLRLGLLLFSIAAIGACTVLTQSRGGQLVLLVVLGVYSIKRFGWRGIVVGAVVALPILIFGGRHSEEADSSSLERLECWYEGMSMVRAYPLLGVGQGQFVEHHYLTAHNAYVLAAAELGLPGLFIWSVLLYLALKIPIEGLRRLATQSGAMAQEARTWAMALLASTLALLVGIFFLSYCYHPVLWICLGMCGAFSSAMRSHDPDWRVRFGWRDALLVAAVDLAILGAVYVYTRVAITS